MKLGNAKLLIDILLPGDTIKIVKEVQEITRLANFVIKVNGSNLFKLDTEPAGIILDIETGPESQIPLVGGNLTYETDATFSELQKIEKEIGDYLTKKIDPVIKAFHRGETQLSMTIDFNELIPPLLKDIPERGKLGDILSNKYDSF